MSDFKYHDKVALLDQIRLKELKKDMPSFLNAYFRGIDTRTTAKTQLAYAYDFRMFFQYLKNKHPLFQDFPIQDFPLSLLEKITVSDLEEYIEFLKYSDDGADEFTIKNHEKGLYRRISSLKSMYAYFYRTEAIKYNPAEIISAPKLHQKDIIRLEANEVAELLDYVESGVGLSGKQTQYMQLTKKRDLAILTLFLGTGIRVSECVGLDIEHVDFKNNGIRILRKGQKESTVYFGEEVEVALLDYLKERKNIITMSGHEHALFLSTRKKRIAVRTVETLVSKYAKTVTPLKKITPHKLRSTFGTALYQETGDIYLVADVLGHSDVNTTKKHYSAQSDYSRRSAAKKVCLRENK